MDFSVQHDATAQRFETTVSGAHCLLDYTIADGAEVNVMTITHTEVPAHVGGQGIASALMAAAVAAAKANGWKVLPACSYAAAWLKRHPEYAHLHA
jgi:predicted GNAT family acetyltransferase